MIHKYYLNESKFGKTEYEFYCPETEEENKQFQEELDHLIKKFRLLDYFIG